VRGAIIKSEEEPRSLKGDSCIVAHDDTFLGKLNPNRYDNESIFNKDGPYGSQYSGTSIFNRYSSYGSPYSKLSPYNRLSNTPPKIYLKGKQIGFLTVNTTILNRVDPDAIIDWAQQHVPNSSQDKTSRM